MDRVDYKAAGILLFSETGEVYMALDKRQRGSDFGGKKIPKDQEQPLITATRECEEECGISLKNISCTDGVYLANSKYYLFFATTGELPVPQNEVEEIKKFASLDAIDIPLNPRLWGHKWLVQAKNWLLENRISRPTLRTVWR
jgi:8-oxo-dGTP pyrophosphatase MutT (NUDIX family)